jgi:transcriptional regulator with XRE-family HTH domain
MARVGVTKAFCGQFGRRLRQLRGAHRPPLTCTALAVRSGVSIPYISQLESGKRAPSLAALISLAGALGVEPGELLFLGVDNPWADLMRAIRARDWAATDAALAAVGMPVRLPKR